jgi:fused signal recognition particle receptor
MTMEAFLYQTMLVLTGILLMLWIVDAVRQRQRRPKPQPFELRKDPAQRVSVPTQPTPVEKLSAPAEKLPTTVKAPSTVKAPLNKEAPPPVEVAAKSWLEKVKSGLSKTRSNLGDNLAALFAGGRKLDEGLLEDIETLLLTADVGIAATNDIIATVTQKLERKQLRDTAELHAALKQELQRLLQPCAVPLNVQGRTPFVMLVVGVNGVGKTTTIGKLARHFQQEGRSVLLAAGDTFRAAAVEQLQVWGERNQVPVIAQHTGADSASVIFDAIQAARARKVDVVIADTAGRLHTKDNLMSELEKVVRVIRKHDPEAPHEVLLVLDAGNGQNALSQAQLFREAVGVSGLAITKLDGTAKGGIVFAIARQHALPIRYIGVGEGIDDLKPFDADTYVQALFD